MSPAAKSAPKKRGLGRGLEALLGPKGAADAPALEAAPGDMLRSLPVDALAPGRYQPRKTMDDAKLAELAESIRAQGVIQPIVVRDLGGRSYEIIAGERRWRASRLAGLSEIPVVVREVEHRVQQLTAGKVPGNGKPAKAAKARPQADIVALERELSETLGSRVNVLHGRGGKGRLVIHYSDLESLDGVLERLRGNGH